MRAVISSRGWLKSECTLAMTMSICARTSSERSSAPSPRMSTSMPAKTRIFAGHVGIDFADVADVFEGALVVEAEGHREILRVVGDGDVLVAVGEAGFGHFADGVLAVGRDGVHVDIAADVLLLDEAWKRVLRGGFDLAAVLAQLGRNPVEVEGAVDVFFGCGGDLGAVIEAGERVLAERIAALERALAHGNVVHLGAGEVLQRGAEGGARQQTDVDLQTGAQVEADLVLAFRDELGNGRIGGGVFDGGGDDVFFAGGAGDEHVEIADGVAAAAERARGRDAFDAGKILEIEGEALGGGLGVIEMEAAAVLAVFVDAFA